MTDTLKAGGAALWPVKMDTGIGGHFGSSFNVEYESEGVLVYKHWEEGTVIADDQVVPTDQQWTAFWKAMETLEGFSSLECDPIQGDHLNGKITWNGNAGPKTQKPVRLRFVLRNAKLYSFWLD